MGSEPTFAEKSWASPFPPSSLRQVLTLPALCQALGWTRGLEGEEERGEEDIDLIAGSHTQLGTVY